jgi:anti-sigma factor RsiW
MSTPTTSHDDILDDLPSLLSGELSPAREREVADHLDSCDPCRRELAVVARASAWLKDAVRLEVVPEMTDGTEEPAALPPLKLPRHSWSPVRRSTGGRSGRPVPRHRARLLTVAAGVVVLVALVGGLLGGVVLGRASNTDPTPVAAALHPVTGGVPVGDAVGEAKVASSEVKLAVRGLPRPPGSDFYEVWLFDPPTGRMLAVGVLPPNGKGSYSLAPGADHGYSAVEISLEPDDGNPNHSTMSVLRGSLT